MGPWFSGIVVHVTAGFSALASLSVIGHREIPEDEKHIHETPHNIPFVALGTALLWFGWFGFNGGLLDKIWPSMAATCCTHTHTHCCPARAKAPRFCCGRQRCSDRSCSLAQSDVCVCVCALTGSAYLFPSAWRSLTL